MRRLICVITMCFMIVALFSGCTLLQKLGLWDSNEDELRPVSSIAIGEDEAKKLSDKMPIHLYFANEDNTKLMKEIRYVPMAEAKKSVNNLASIIVDELIEGPSAESGLKRTIPVGTKQRAKVKIDAATGIATVDLSKEFIDKHPGGKAEERMTIYSIVNSLTELKEIQKVKFLIEGKPSKEFKGNFQFDVPFPRTVSLISKEAPTSSIMGDLTEEEEEASSISNELQEEIDVDSELDKEEMDVDSGADEGELDVSGDLEYFEESDEVLE